MEFKDRIKSLRKEQGMSLTELASLFKKTESACRAWELGRTKPDVDTLIKLAKHFDCTTDYLLGMSEYKNIAKIKRFEGDVDTFVRAIEGKENASKIFERLNRIAACSVFCDTPEDADRTFLDLAVVILYCLADMVVLLQETVANPTKLDERIIIDNASALTLCRLGAFDALETYWHGALSLLMLSLGSAADPMTVSKVANVFFDGRNRIGSEKIINVFTDLRRLSPDAQEKE